MIYHKREKLEIRFSGTGGQGLVLASIILAEALMTDGFNIVTAESHGIEARGGASSAEVIASKKEIYDLSVTLPDILVAISQQAYDKYAGKIKQDSLVMLDSSLVKKTSTTHDENTYAFPFIQIVKKELGTVLPTNICFLGALVAISQIVQTESLREAILNRVPKKSGKLNLKAFELGYRLVK